MTGTRSIKRIKSPEKKKKLTNTAPQTPAAAPKATASKPPNIPLSDVSPEFKRLVSRG